MPPDVCLKFTEQTSKEIKIGEDSGLLQKMRNNYIREL